MHNLGSRNFHSPKQIEQRHTQQQQHLQEKQQAASRKKPKPPRYDRPLKARGPNDSFDVVGLKILSKVEDVMAQCQSIDKEERSIYHRLLGDMLVSDAIRMLHFIARQHLGRSTPMKTRRVNVRRKV